MALLFIIVIAVTAIVIVVVIMKRRQSKQGSVDTTAWSNPSYEDRELHNYYLVLTFYSTLYSCLLIVIECIVYSLDIHLHNGWC